MRRVVVTGIGSLTPLGNSFTESWEALKSGRSGIREIARFDAKGLPWKMAGELKNFDPGGFLTNKETKRLDPFVQYAVAAATMAADDAGILNSGSFRDTGVIIGSSRGGISMLERELKKSRPSAYLMPATTISMAASYVAQKISIRGYCLGISNACASGANAIGEAYRLIKSGILKIVLAGGSEAPICRICLEGYGVSGVLSIGTTNTPKPFDKKRDGFVLSEGSCVIVLEDIEVAMKRGARIYGEVIGYGNIVDAFHMTRPSHDGEAITIDSAMREAGAEINEIDLVSTHGTGTRIGDLVEIKALRSIFKDRQIPALAVKSMTGHMLGASGAFEVAATLKSLQENIIPPTINVSYLEDDCRLKIFRQAEKRDLNIAISNSFGFGGVNTVLVLKKTGS